ncbi:alpha/beta fold hydrolase [Sphingomonas sp. ID0503]|uniref:alpha/beta fold hydrolase n=1 Tax=Sphingomonas sp. ID0503 TaxID=3399691 RepID=UPI003AFB59FA
MRATRFSTAGGLTLVGDVGGDPAAPCVILMHGGGQTRFSWMGAGAALVAACYHVINFDARGHGESDWAGPGGYSLALHARDLAEVAGGLPGPVALVGASLGGATALRAMADGMRPAAVVLVDIVPNPDPKGVARIREFMLGKPDGFETLEEVADAIAAYNPHRRRPADLEGLRRNLRETETGRFRWHWDPAFLGREIDSELAELADTVEGAREAQDTPVLLIRGSSSDVVNDTGTAILQDVLPRLEIFDVAGAGHMVAGDRNDVFNGGMLQFLARYFPATAR